MKYSALLGERSKTKIVCTLGPASDSSEMIRELISKGMSVARFNLSHGSLESHQLSIELVRKESTRMGCPVGIMVDVPGPKYRIGPLSVAAVDLKSGDQVILSSEDIVGNNEIMAVSPSGIHVDASIGRPILVDDGLIEMTVTGKKEDQVFCRVVVGGKVTEGRGVTTPGRAPSQPFLNAKTVESLKFAAEQKSDFVALSVITEDSQVHSAKEMLNTLESNPKIITKIERAEALKNIDSILEASDGVMVARGDMGVEVPVERVPIIQKDLISRCNMSGKPVITATQMLESMIDSPVPTRAEVTDVANAIFDGTDAIMLSAETSVGKYPANAVNVMSRVAKEAEAALPYDSMMRSKAFQLEAQTDDAISYDACRTAHQLNAKAIVAFTESGGTAGRVSKYRPKVPILAITPSEKVQQTLTLRWGVTPLTVEHLTLVEDFFGKGEEMAEAAMGLKKDDLVVLVAGLPIGIAGGTNLLRVLKIGETVKHI